MSGKSGVSMNWGGFDKALEKGLNALANQKKELLETIGDILVSSTVQRFKDGKGPDGKSWEPSGRAWKQGLAVKGRKATEKRKAVRGKRETGKFGKTLLDTGLLRNSIDYTTALDGVYVGSNLKYARIHQMGGKTGKGHSVTMPARPYLGISNEDKEEVKQAMQDFLSDAFKA